MSDSDAPRPVRACLIVNARSDRSGAAAAEALPVLASQGWDVTVRTKREKGEAKDLARQAAEDGYDPIVNCGGDGTQSEIVDALARTDVALGTIPGGTENVWSKEIGISSRPRVAALQLAASQRIRVDVGKAEVDGSHVGHFLMMAGVGADGAVMNRVSRGLKNKLGPIAVGVAAVETLPALRPFAVRIVMDGVQWEGEMTELIAGNTRLYGGFTRVTPGAYVDDGLLDICVFTTDGVLGTGRQMASLLLRRHPSQVSSESYRASHLTIQAETPLPLQCDGSAIDHRSHHGPVRYDFSAVPDGLTVLIPRTYDGELFQHGVVPNGKSVSGKGKKGKKKKSS